jgi:hypothetical protein
MKNFILNNKLIGTLRNDGVFYKSVDKTKHFMRSLMAWGIDSIVLTGLPPETKILLQDKKLKTQWETTVGEWKNKGYEKNFGCGSQIFLDEKYFAIINDKQSKLW